MEQPSSGINFRNNIFSKIVNHDLFIKIIIVLILTNSLLIGLETFPRLYEPYQQWFHFFDTTLLWLFTIEIVLRLLAAKPTYAFFKNGWNIFDFIIVASGHLLAGGQYVTVLRMLRILRLLRTFSVIPSLRKMVNALLMTIPALGNIIFLMCLVMYIFGVAGTILFREAAPEYFGSLPASVLTLFQVATLESWASGVMRPLLVAVPWSWAYFVLFILIGTFVVINLFLGVIVNSMDKATQMEDAEKEAANPNPKRDTHQEILSLREEIAELKQIVLSQSKKQP
jgi:voltage-gated sodium channel